MGNAGLRSALRRHKRPDVQGDLVNYQALVLCPWTRPIERCYLVGCHGKDPVDLSLLSGDPAFY